MSSYLFVPANRPERFIKACQSGADAVIFDLEDTVAPPQKAQARLAVLEFLHSHQDKAAPKFWLRLNHAKALDDDLAFLSAHSMPLSALILPKVESATPIHAVFNQTQLPVVVLIESAKGLTTLPKIASTKGVQALSFGLLDLGRDFGVALDTQGADIVFNQVRYTLLLASVQNGLKPPIETIFKDYKDKTGFLKAAKLAYEMGFGGQLCIHPEQVALAKLSYQASTHQLKLAQAIMAEFERTGAYAFAVEGMMVDLPLIEWARTLIDYPVKD